MTGPLPINFARLCRETRTMPDITQAELSAAVGVSRSHIAGIETGRVDPIPGSRLLASDEIESQISIDRDLLRRHSRTERARCVL